MKKHIAYLVLAGTLSLIPLTVSTGCAVAGGRESAGAYAHDKEIATRIKTNLYKDPAVKGSEVAVNVLNGQVQLSGFVETPEAKRRAEEIAASTPGVARVYNNIVVGTTPTPTGR